MYEELKEPFAYEYKHENGDSKVITRASGYCGNTYIGKEANDLMFEMYSRMRNLEFEESEFNNMLLIELNKRKVWSKVNETVSV